MDAAGSGDAQRTRSMLILLMLPSAILPMVDCEPSFLRAISTSKDLYGLRARDLVALRDAARTTALLFLVIPMRFIRSFSMAGMRIERSLRSFLLAIAFCVARSRAAKVSRVTCSVRTDVPLNAS